jgi:hypothetical protein
VSTELTLLDILTCVQFYGSVFGESKLILMLWVQEICLVKSLMPSWASPVGKRVWARFAKCKNLRGGIFIDYKAP